MTATGAAAAAAAAAASFALRRFSSTVPIHFFPVANNPGLCMGFSNWPGGGACETPGACETGACAIPLETVEPLDAPFAAAACWRAR